MKTYYYLLRGDSEEVGLGEVRALLDIYSREFRLISCYTSICIFQHDENIYEKIIQRSGFIKEAGEVVEVIDLGDVEPSYIKSLVRDGLIRTKVFKKTCSVERLRGLVETVHYTKRITRDKLSNKVLYCSENKLILGSNPISINSRELEARKPSLRPFFRSIALKPNVARLLINLARVKEGDVLLDPFAGTGSIPLEAGLLGLRYIAVDLDKNLVIGMKRNLDYYRVLNGLVIHSDSTELSFNYIDGIATDPPYGRSTKTFGDKVVEVYDAFLNLASNFLKKHGFMSFLAPLSIEELIDESIYRNDLILYDKHYLYVHGGLTRVIYEVFRS